MPWGHQRPAPDRAGMRFDPRPTPARQPPTNTTLCYLSFIQESVKMILVAVNTTIADESKKVQPSSLGLGITKRL